MTTIAKLNADLTVNSSSFEAGFKRSDSIMKKSVDQWSRQLGKVATDFDLVGKGAIGMSAALGFAGGVISTVVVGGLKSLVLSSIEAASAVDDTSQRLQISTDNFQKYSYAAKLAGLSNEELESAITKLNAKIAAGDLKYKSTTEAIDSIADAVQNAGSDFERAAIVNDAFGAKMGSKLIPLLSQGSEGLRRLGDEAERTGNVIGGDIIQKTAKLGDDLDVLFSTIRNNIQGGFLESLVGEAGDLRDVFADPNFAKNMQAVGAAIGDITTASISALAQLGSLISKYKELDEAGKNYLKSLDESLGLKNPFELPPDKYPRKSEPYGPPVPRGGLPAPRGNAPDYVSSEANKAAENAAKAAARAAEQAMEKKADLIRSLREESVELVNQNMLYGQKEGLIAREQRALQIRHQLAREGIELSQQEQAEVDKYLDAIQMETDKLKELEAAKKKQEELDRDRQQAMAQLASSVSSAFEDAIINGEDLSDVLKGLADDIAKLFLRRYVTGPLFEGILGVGGEGEGASWLNLPSFAVGTSYVPRDMVANIHKGEMIIPADEAAALRSGNGGGSGGVVVNITNQSGAKVTTNSRETENGIDVDVLIAESIGRPGSKTGQALAAFNNRGLTRR